MREVGQSGEDGVREGGGWRATHHVDLEVGGAHQVLLVLRPGDVLEDVLKRVRHDTLQLGAALQT